MGRVAQGRLESNLWVNRATFSRHLGSNQNDPVPNKNAPTESTIQEKITFPNPSDPFSNPLAPLSSESPQQESAEWKGEKPGPVARLYLRKVDDNGMAYAEGGRKRSFARVWIKEGTGTVIVNGKSWIDYFVRLDQRDKILRPMVLLGVVGKFDLSCSVNGGGETGQAEAIRFALARALQNWEPSWRSTLKKDGLLRRDARIVESKKFGRPKARKSFQWVKR